MNICVDLRHVVPALSGGLADYVRGLLSALAGKVDRIVAACTPFSRMTVWDLTDVEAHTLPLDDYAQRLADLAREADVLIRSWPTDSQVDFPNGRQLWLIPDLQHDDLPELFDRQTLGARRGGFHYALSTGAAFATLSDYCRRRIADHPWYGGGNIVIAPPALATLRDGSAELPDLPERFLLYPANRWPHKNHARLLDALAIARQSTNAHLVLTGNGERISADGVHDLGYVSDATLAILYQRAAGLIFPTLYEGFGMPVLQALAVCLPVACSDIPALRELAGDTAELFDPTDPRAIANAMASLLNPPDDETVIRRDIKGKSIAAKHNWDASADAILAACHKLTQSTHIETRDPPLVSIVTPSYNQGEFIEQTIQSVRRQTYPNIEHLVIDGGSTDNTVSLLKKFQNHSANYRYLSETDRGQTDAINKGMRMAAGDVLAYLNSDDVLLPNAVEQAVRHLEQQPACDLVYGDADYIDADGNVTGNYRTTDYSIERLFHDNCICQPAAFWRRRIVQLVGEFDESLQTAMDYEFWLRVHVAGGRIEHAPLRWAQSRLHADAKTLTQRQIIYDEVFRICRRHAGRVSFNYIVGAWHQRAQAGWLKLLPGSYMLAAFAHYLALHPADAANGLLGITQRIPWAGKPLVKLAHRIARRHASRGLRRDHTLSGEVAIETPRTREPHLIVSANTPARVRLPSGQARTIDSQPTDILDGITTRPNLRLHIDGEVNVIATNIYWEQDCT